MFVGRGVLDGFFVLVGTGGEVGCGVLDGAWVCVGTGGEVGCGVLDGALVCVGTGDDVGLGVLVGGTNAVAVVVGMLVGVGYLVVGVGDDVNGFCVAVLDGIGVFV